MNDFPPPDNSLKFRDEQFDLINDFIESFGDIVRKNPLEITNSLLTMNTLMNLKRYFISPKSYPNRRHRIKLEQEHIFSYEIGEGVDKRTYFGRADFTMSFVYQNEEVVILVGEVKRSGKLKDGMKQTIMYLLSAAERMRRLTQSTNIILYGLTTDGRAWVITEYAEDLRLPMVCNIFSKFSVTFLHFFIFEFSFQ